MPSPGNVNLLLLEGFNNYYNRIVKKHDTLTAYSSLENPKISRNIYNFNTNDGINAVVEITYEENNFISPDYIVVHDDLNNILSRWFVLDETRLRGNQYRYMIRRDVIVDYYDGVISAPMFIEKAYIRDINDPAIYNSENMGFNQIKQSETLLKDNSGCSWIVGYIATKSAEETQPIDVTASIKPISNFDKTVWENAYGQYLGQHIIKPVDFVRNRIFLRYEYTKVSPRGVTYRYGTTLSAGFNPEKFDSPSQYNSFDYEYHNAGGKALSNIYGPEHGSILSDEQINTIESIGANVISAVKGSFGNDYYIPSDDFESLLKENGKILYYTDSVTHLTKYYKVVIKQNVGNHIVTPVLSTPSKEDYAFTVDGYKLYTTNNQSPYDTYFQSAIRANDSGFTMPVNIFRGGEFSYYFEFPKVEVSLEPVDDLTVSVSIPVNRPVLNEAPYCMFAMPYENGICTMVNSSGSSQNYSVRKDVALAIAQAISNKLGSKLYDLQLVPFCPIQDAARAAGVIISYQDSDINIVKEGVGWSKVETTENTVVQTLIWCRTNSGTFNIKNTIPLANNILDQKTKCCTDFYRLCSPDGSSIFEFNPVKNGGVEYFNVDFLYKPYSPYIHVNPNFGKLYGQDFNDARGLVAIGDYSMTRTTNQFAEYELNNKNFQLTFDRQIENMEFNNAYQRREDIDNAIIGAINGASSGASAGAMIGGGIGAGVGAAVGAIGAGITGAIDVKRKDELRAETLDYTKDLFGYELGNIKARPDTLNGVSAITPNNKIFPYLEHYSCTAKEKEALQNKIKYNGMTIMRIGTPSEFIRENDPQYLKGQLIRIEDMPADTHTLNSIYEELYKGVFI